MSAADDLHEQLFGFRPKKKGTAYERLGAIVLASLGWDDIHHDTTLRPAQKRAKHQLDITATNPDGSIRRLLVECKDWDKKVKKPTLDSLVGVRTQLGFDAAMAVTTVGFTAGAIDVAADENIAMVILRPHGPNDHGRFVRRAEAKLDFHFLSFHSFDLELAAHDLPFGQKFVFRLAEDDRLQNLDGTSAETIREILEVHSGGPPKREGDFHRHARFDGGRSILAVDGTAVPIRGLKWVERLAKTTETVVVEAEGNPCLVVEQLDEHGDPDHVRLVVDRHLNAWEITAGGHVVPRDGLS
jgi:hypothetical protein